MEGFPQTLGGVLFVFCILDARGRSLGAFA